MATGKISKKEKKISTKAEEPIVTQADGEPELETPAEISKPEEGAKPAEAAPPKKKAAKKAAVKKAAGKVTKPAAPKTAKTESVKKPRVKSKRAKGPGKPGVGAGTDEKARILDSQVVYEGPLFRVLRDHLIEPGGRESRRDVIRHNGSVVILAVDHDKRGKKKNPWVVIERQYRHAAGQFLWELPAGKLDAGETTLDGAKRELAEETGYAAKKWSPLVEYYASPGFLGEAMKVFLAEGLVAGDAHPEEDEFIDFRLVRLSDLLDLVEKGEIIDGKTLTTVLFYARQLGVKRKK